MSNKIIIPTIFVFLVVLLTGCTIIDKKTNIEVSQTNLPKYGDNYVLDGESFRVIFAGANPYSHTSTGESLVLINLGISDQKVVVVPDKGMIIQVDPTIPSLLVGDTEKLSDYFEPGVYLLLEYDR